MKRLGGFFIILLLCSFTLADVTTTHNRNSFSCNGATTEFDFTFDVMGGDTSDIIVVLRDSDGEETTLSETTDYTVSATNNDYRSGPGGTVTTVETYASGYTLVVYREEDATNSATLKSGSRLDTTALQNEIDKLYLLIQDLQGQLDRCQKVPVSDSSTIDLDLPTSAVRANTYPYFGDDGALTVVDSVASDNTVVSTYMETVVDDDSGKAALTTMGGIYVANVVTYGADPTGVNDSTTAIRAAIAASHAARYTDRVDGAILSGSKPIVYFPDGDFRISGQLAGGDHQTLSYVTVMGDDARILCDSNDFTVFQCYFDVDIHGLIFHDGDYHIYITNANINTATFNITDCQFHDPDTAAIYMDDAPDSTQLNVERCKFRCRMGDNGGYILYKETGFAFFSQCWFSSYHTIGFYNVGQLTIRDSTGVPSDEMCDTGGCWVKMGSTGSLILDGFRMGAEDGGAEVIVESSLLLDSSEPITPKSIIIQNCALHWGSYIILFHELPNFINIQNNHGRSGAANDIFDFDDTSIDNDDLENFAWYGEVVIANNFGRVEGTWIESDDADSVGAMATALFLVKLARSGNYHNPAPNRLNSADVVGSAEHVDAGWTRSGDLTTAFEDDDYDVQQRKLTADNDNEYYTFYDNDYLDESNMVYGTTYTWMMKYDASGCSAPAHFQMYLGGSRGRVYPVLGKGWIAHPFLYLNDDGAASVLSDKCYIKVMLDQDGDIFRCGRMVLVKGLYTHFNSDVLEIAYNTSPAEIVEAIVNHIGYFRGDLCWNTELAAGENIGWACSTAGDAGTWVPFGMIQSADAYTTSNVTPDRTINADDTSEAELADVLCSVIEDLKTAGILKSP